MVESVEVVEDELGPVAGGRAVASYLLGHDERRQLEASRGAVGQLDDPEAGDRRLLDHDALLGVVLGEDEQVGEAALDRGVAHLLDRALAALAVLGVGEQLDHLGEELLDVL